MKTILLSNGLGALVDDEDYAKAALYKWRPAIAERNRMEPAIYARAWTPMKKGKRNLIMLHHLILDLKRPFSLNVDHIDGNTLNNQKCNLRICTRAQNSRNRAKPLCYTSKFKGVCWNKSARKWKVALKYLGKEKYLGYFDDETEAARAYNNAAILYFGEFARLNNVGGG